jgi:hypothetical protein
MPSELKQTYVILYVAMLGRLLTTCLGKSPATLFSVPSFHLGDKEFSNQHACEFLEHRFLQRHVVLLCKAETDRVVSIVLLAMCDFLLCMQDIS